MKYSKSIYIIFLILITSSVTSNASKCSDVFESAFSSDVKVNYSGTEIEIRSNLKSRIDKLTEELSNAKQNNLIVYVPVETSDGMANIKIEKDKAKSVSVSVVAQSKMNVEEFKTLIDSTRNPSAEFSRNVLNSELLPSTNIDKKKEVYLKDIYYYGVLPASLGKYDVKMIGSASSLKALSNSQLISQQKTEPSKITIVSGYPESRGDLQTIFQEEKTDSIEVWKERQDELRKVADKYDSEFIDAKKIRKIGNKKEMLQRLSRSKTIIFIVAHANGCHVRLPSGKVIDIIPEDIAKLNFIYSPFVMLRICNGIDNGYADAFLNAGASGVWVNRGVISPKNANEQVETFLEALEKNNKVNDAIQEVKTKYEDTKFNTEIFVKRIGKYMRKTLIVSN